MKKFTCREMGGPCDEVFEGATADEVAKKGGDHLMNSTDDAHKAMRDQMVSSSVEEKDKWLAWFKGEWDKKADA